MYYYEHFIGLKKVQSCPFEATVPAQAVAPLKVQILVHFFLSVLLKVLYKLSLLLFHIVF